jgi:hypothetical protein
MPYKTEIAPVLIVARLEEFAYGEATAIAVVLLVLLRDAGRSSTCSNAGAGGASPCVRAAPPAAGRARSATAAGPALGAWSLTWPRGGGRVLIVVPVVHVFTGAFSKGAAAIGGTYSATPTPGTRSCSR